MEHNMNYGILSSYIFNRLSIVGAISLPRIFLSVPVFFFIFLTAFEASGEDEKIITSYGYSYFGDLKYPENYKHFDYVNPNAPVGGEISIAISGSFDSMNPYSRKGRASLLSSSMYESLLGESLTSGGSMPADAFGEYYGLLAHKLEYPESKDWVIFHMRPEARFSDGTPVTAHDVLFSHNLLLDQGLKSYAEGVRKLIPNAEVVDDHTLKFYFADGVSRRSLIEQVGFVPVWSKAWYEKTGARLDEPRIETSPGSGPYVVDEVEVNRRMTLRRNPDYWGWHLPINRGRYNFEKIRLEYFADSTAAFEAFKAGEVTYRTESDPKLWASAYDFPAIENGWVARENLLDGTPPAMSGIVFNTRKELLKNKNVRKAIALAFNFEWINKSLYYGLFDQQRSFSNGTEMEAIDIPEGIDREILVSLGDLVAEEILISEPLVPHTSDPERLATRKNLRQALKLMSEAGWNVDNDGRLVNADDEQMLVEFLLNSSASPTTKAISENFVSTLKQLGVNAQLQTVDSAQYTDRERKFDYDLIFDGYPALMSVGHGLSQRLGSEDADYSVFNPAGLASPLVDAVIDVALSTGNKQDEIASLRVLDRVLRYEFILIPEGYKPDHWVAYWDMYSHPETIPPFALGTLDFWWFDEEKAAGLESEGAL